MRINYQPYNYKFDYAHKYNNNAVIRTIIISVALFLKLRHK